MYARKAHRNFYHFFQTSTYLPALLHLYLFYRHFFAPCSRYSSTIFIIARSTKSSTGFLVRYLLFNIWGIPCEICLGISVRRQFIQGFYSHTSSFSIFSCLSFLFTFLFRMEDVARKKARCHFGVTRIIYRCHRGIIYSIDLLFLQLHEQVLSHHLPYYIFRKKFLLCSLQFLVPFPLQLKHGKFVCAYYRMPIL